MCAKTFVFPSIVDAFKTAIHIGRMQRTNSHTTKAKLLEVQREKERKSKYKAILLLRCNTISVLRMKNQTNNLAWKEH